MSSDFQSVFVKTLFLTRATSTLQFCKLHQESESSQYFSFQKRLPLPPDFGSQQQVQDQHSTYCHASLQVAQFITEGFSVPFIKITECKIQRAENNVILGTFLKRFKLVPVLSQILENTHL